MRPRFIFIHLLLCLGFFLFQPRYISGQIEFPTGSTFQYLKGKDAQGLGPDWMNTGFDDSGWGTANAPFHYGDGEGGTLLDDMQHSYSVVYLRSSFTAEHVDSLGALIFSVDYDDGFVIWINGERVLSQLAPSVLSHNGFATANHESGMPEIFELDPAGMNLVEGNNTLAIQGFNISLESTDFHMDMSIHAHRLEAMLIDTVGLTFTVPSGFYDSSFYVDIIPADTSWNIIYTLDGSNPMDSQTGFVSEGGASIWIDPDDRTGRPRTPAVILRASAGAGGVTPSIPESRTYIFLDKVLTQSFPGGGWPSNSINDQVMDLSMDNQIVYHEQYEEALIPSLKAIPSISVLTSLANLFDKQRGIYVNAEGHGHAWERECSVELLHPGGASGFNVNAGLRIRGGWSRHPDFPKHAFRLFFRSEYGNAKLDYPLFGTEGVDRYDKIDLRTAQNYAWSNGDERNTFLRDVFSRDLQRDMGQPYTRSRYYHLYLNGMYWGLFQTQERSEARFAADYFGGKTDDYDVIKVNTEHYVYQIEATDGNSDSWYILWDMCKSGFEKNADYFKLVGKDPRGDPLVGGEVMVDIDNLIDYMLSIFHTGNFDAPTSTFGGNKGPNNFYAVNNREDRSEGFRFFNHDAEHAMFSEVVDPGTGLYEDRVNLTKRTDGKHMEVDHFGSFHPQWLHHKLTANTEYCTRFMDRAFKHMERNGALTPAACRARLNTRAEEIELAIIAESARWGDARPWVSDPYNRDDHWNPQVQKIRNEFFPYRTGILKEQLRNAGLYSFVEAPDFSSEGVALLEETKGFNETIAIRIKNPNSFGELCYTLDGSDPRDFRGRISEKAIRPYEQEVNLDLNASSVIKARIYNSGNWSALNEVKLLTETEDYSGLAVTELHYHPEELLFQGDTLSGKDLEFIEFKNTGEHAINLSGLVVDSAITYVFPEEQVLVPGEFYVLASRPSAFYVRYGMVASGNYRKNLSNGGEEVIITDRDGNPLINFIYSDDLPWPAEADGFGYSLVSVDYDPEGDPAEYSYWKTSSNLHGSPFKDDPLAESDRLPGIPDAGIWVYPNPTSGILHVELPAAYEDLQLSIYLYGMKGNLVYQTILQGSGTLHLEEAGITSGLYMLRILTEDQLFTRKIVFRQN